MDDDKYYDRIISKLENKKNKNAEHLTEAKRKRLIKEWKEAKESNRIGRLTVIEKQGRLSP